jgi:hypothetical protein
VHRLHRLPLAVVEQPVKVLRGRVSLRLPTETRTELIEELAQSSQQRARGAGRHACSVQDLRKKYKSLDRATSRTAKST